MDDLIREAAQRLADGRLVAFPTETVYGLGADAENEAAIARIYAAKGRPSDHPVIVHVADGANLEYRASHVPVQARRLIDAFWPGPLTLILPRADRVPAAVAGGQDTIGLRCPSHPVAQDLLEAFSQLKGGNAGVAAPSANKFGQVSPTQADHVRAEFVELGDEELLVLEGGASEVGIESTIVDLSRLEEGVGPMILRPGHITADDLSRVLGTEPESLFGLKRQGADQQASENKTGAPRVSGSLKAHYAPRTPLFVLPQAEILQWVAQLPQDQLPIACVVFDAVENPVLPGVEWVLIDSDPKAYARKLYALLRQLDRGGYRRLVFEQPPSSAAWRAINDRLGRAAAAFSK